MSPDLRALGEAWGRFADALIASGRRREAPWNAKAGTAPVAARPGDLDRDLPADR